MSKVVTCAAALQLFEEGRYLLNDPLYEYMPEFKDMVIRHSRGNGEIEEKPAMNPIRIVDLFTMSSGYSYDVPDAFAFLENTSGNVTLNEMAKTLAKQPINFEPGTHWCYGFSHDILGALIEVISGKTIGKYYADYIFKPLDMHDTGFKVPKNKQHRIVTCYEYNEAGKSYKKALVPLGYLNYESPFYLSDDWIHEMPGGGLISSVNDYAKFANTLANKGLAASHYRLLGEPTINLMTTNHLDETRIADYGGTWAHHAAYGYGLGVRTMINPTAGGSPSCFGEYGWSGLAGTQLLIDPVKELTYVYAQQTYPSNEAIVAPRIRNVIYGCLE
jgi:CubicO group peptidase (beta-lactamase class C family)